MLQLEVVPGARLEILEATQWLAEQSPGLADDLASEIHRVILLLHRQPGLGVLVPGAHDGTCKMRGKAPFLCHGAVEQPAFVRMPPKRRLRRFGRTRLAWCEQYSSYYQDFF